MSTIQADSLKIVCPTFCNAMPREFEDYRGNIALLTQMFPNRATISVEEAAAVIGCDKRTIVSNKEVPIVRVGRKITVPLVGLARYLSKH